MNIWPHNFADNMMKRNRAEMNDKELSEYYPSFMRLDTSFNDLQGKQPTKPADDAIGRINKKLKSANYRNITTGQMRAKLSDFIPSVADFEAYLKE